MNNPMRHLLILACLAISTASARPVITQTLCNYQTEATAIVDGVIRVGWQYCDSEGQPSMQDSYELVVTERITGRQVCHTGVVRSDQSQFVELPQLPYNRYGYSWRVRMAQDGQWSDWSREQTIRVTPELGLQTSDQKPQTSDFGLQTSDGGEPRWIGAITKAAARIPDGRWSNEVFKKDTFQLKWKDVDTLSARSIVVRREFATAKPVVDAVVYVCGLGHYELSIDGQKVGDSEFAPLWSEYARTIYYNTFDVTEQLKATSAHCLHVLLGNGFFNVQRGGRYSKLQTSFGPPQLLLRLDISYADGTTERVVSDASWRWTPSPVTFNSIYGGESYDARLEQPAALRAGFDDSGWQPVVLTEGPAGRLRPETCQPVKVMEYYDVVSWKPIPADSIDSASKQTRRQVDASAFVCDMGQNLAGFPEITVSGKPGQKVTLIVSERLTPQGVCDQRQTGRQHYYEYTIGNRPSPRRPSPRRPSPRRPSPQPLPIGRGVDSSVPDSSATKSIGTKSICSPPCKGGAGGGSAVSWHPRFSYYGFRYIQVEGAVWEGQPNPRGLPVLHRLRSCFVYNSAAETSSFWCDNERFTRIHRLIERAERSNMQAVMTDCPHREKLGWLEQDHLCGPSLLFNYDMTRLVPKIIRDIVDTQEDNGFVPTTAPRFVSFGNLFDDSPEWGSTLIILPFQYYDMYGDSTLIVDNYEPMRRYVDYLTSRSTDGIVSHGLGDWYDYGPWRAGFSRNTPVPLVATAHYIYDLQLVSEAARMAGHTDDARHYRQRYDEVVSSFNRHFYHADSCYYGTNSQTSNALPLFLGIAPDKEGVLQNLVADIHAHGDRLTTGDVGNRYLFRVLADNGLSDLLFRMLNHDEAPGYGYQLAQGATTLTEQWDPRQGSSENHFMLGQIDEWLFRTLSGIGQQPGTHGMRRLVVNPQLVGDITQVRTTIHTLYGPVTVSYDKTDGKLQVKVPGGVK